MSQGTALSSLLAARRRLRDRIALAAAYRIVLILAPAGYGKSVALRQYLEAAERPRVLYEVARDDTSLLSFVRGLSRALAPVAAEAYETAAHAVQSALLTDAPAKALAQWLKSHLRDFDGIIAIDDLHTAESDSHTSSFLAELIDGTKEMITWIISARSTHLPISSWIAYGEADVPIGEDDLALTLEDALEAARAHGSPLGATDVERLMQLTSGWPTAFGLALRVAQRADDLPRVASTTRSLSFKYLADHVFRSLEEQEQSLLTFAAVLPEIDVDLLERCGFAEAGALLAGLQQKGTFLALLDAPGRPARYSCHALFRAFLEHQLELRGARQYNDVRVRAAQALRTAGRAVDALRLFADARSFDDVLALLEEHGFDLCENGHSDALEYAIDVLPQQEQNGHPIVLGLRAQIAANAERYNRAHALFERAIAASDAASQQGRLMLLLAQVHSYQGNMQQCLSLLESAHAAIASNDPLLPELLSWLSLSRAALGRIEGVATLLDEAERLSRGVDSEHERGKILARLGVAATLTSDEPRAARVLQSAAEIAFRCGYLTLKRSVYSILCIHELYDKHDLSKAREYAVIESETAHKCGETYHIRGSLLRRLAIEVRVGDEDAVADALAQLDALPASDDPRTRALVFEGQAMIAAWERRFDDAYALFAQAAEDIYPPQSRALMRALQALCGSVGTRRSPTQNIEGLIRALPPRAQDLPLALYALAESLADRSQSATRALQSVAESASPVVAALRRISLALGRHGTNLRAEDVNDALSEMRQHHYGGYARVIEALLGARQDETSDVVLTPSEIAVLRALSEGSVPKEIAAALDCSVNTVRAHIQHAIAKFGCSGRDQAVRLARARGLI